MELERTATDRSPMKFQQVRSLAPAREDEKIIALGTRVLSHRKRSLAPSSLRSRNRPKLVMKSWSGPQPRVELLEQELKELPTSTVQASIFDSDKMPRVDDHAASGVIACL